MLYVTHTEFGGEGARRYLVKRSEVPPHRVLVLRVSGWPFWVVKMKHKLKSNSPALSNVS